MSRRGGSQKKAVMTDVEPGEKTGIYYMPICNVRSHMTTSNLIPKRSNILYTPFHVSPLLFFFITSLGLTYLVHSTATIWDIMAGLQGLASC